MFKNVNPKQNFPSLESEVLSYWKENNIFEKSKQTRDESNPYRFYDGPPFITGTPHYGSLLSSVVKDVAGRYWTMRWRYVDRVWGWDCHGLPIEEKVQKKLWLESNKQIEERGIKEFIDGCYEYTETTSAEWNWYVDKIGRWVDMDRAYRTMDQDYMESVMWVFKQLWDKGLVYKWKRVSLYSWKLSTPISNFEVAMDDTYQEVNDPAITVKFDLEQDPEEINKKEGGNFEYTKQWYLRYVLAVIKNEKWEILQLKNTKHGGKWQCPGGKIDAGETAEQALKREVLEELGVACDVHQKLSEQKIIASGVLWQWEYYEVTLLGEPKIQEPHKHEKLEWAQIIENDDGTKLLKTETEQYSDEDFIRENYDLSHLYNQNNTTAPISVLAWTTTPWTIPANMALTVGADIDYVLVQNNDELFIVAKNRSEAVFKGKGEYKIIRQMKGSELVWLAYKPPFDYFYKKTNNPKDHKIYAADFATDTDGTGIVHTAPEFGDVDYLMGKENGITITEALDDEGRYTHQINDCVGVHYLDANKENTEKMKNNGTLFKNESITHRIPFCPRSGTPLVQKAQDSWFIDIQSQKEKLLQANEQINWFPTYLKHGRFAKGIASAPDWCISRTRFWGAPMPVWIDGNGEMMVAESREKIFEKNIPFSQLSRLIITRHAESTANVDGKYDDTGLAELSPKWVKQAKELAEKLCHLSIDAIITSPAVRAIETARPLAEKLGLEIIIDERLHEVNHGNMARETDKNKRLAERDKVFFSDDKNKKFGETGESYNDVLTRMQSFVEDIATNYPGKTVFVVSHGLPTSILNSFVNLKKLHKHALVKNAEPKTHILDCVNKNGLNLHRPYIDNILFPNEKNPKAKNVLGIHWHMNEGLDDNQNTFWKDVQTHLQQKSIPLTVPRFDNSEQTHYATWKTTFDKQNFANFDTVVAHSLGCPMVIEYILEKNISLDRLVLVAPSGLKGNTKIEHILSELHHDPKKLTNLVKEIIVLHSEDDGSTSATFSYGKQLAKDINAHFIGVNGYGHNFHTNRKIIAEIVASGTPFKRINEVLDVWMDSGSMPYAQMHYPFENKTAMEASFPADFIAEYVGQVRAWFYVMHVLWVLLNPTHQNEPTPSFTNVITTGVINGNDGRKMSKSFGNYPDPRATIEKYGADPIRFYMLNSPLLSGGDMDFKEEGIIETIKTVMLPIWNTYSFFTTYANIDHWQKNTTEVWFTRHAESTSNVTNKMSDGSDNPDLTEKWIIQAQNAGKYLKEQGAKFDYILITDRIHTRKTAEQIAKELNFTGEIVVEDGFTEQTAGEYANLSLEEIRQKAELPQDATHADLRKAYKNNSQENIQQFEKRIIQTYESVLQKYAGKKILIVAHAGTPRPILAKYFGMDPEKAYYDTNILNADPFKLTPTKIVNPLDQWIISKLQVLIAQVHDAMDAYDVSRATRSIVDYMNELTNWYVRLSRRRFWGSDMTDDKTSAYETLYTVLVELSKLLAPFMPFMAESIFRGLTNKESVHLEYITRPNRYLISTELNNKMAHTSNYVSLGLALRSRKNIRVRQPLQSVTIPENLDEYYKNILRDELNVKEILFEKPENLAKKICKPDARKIGPKYGKNVQTIIVKAKNGEFQENADGSINVGDFRLEADEFAIEYLPLEGVSDIEGGYGTVISLNTQLSSELITEGNVRDIIRQIQDMRKEANYQVTNHINVSIALGANSFKNPEILSDILSLEGMITKETLSTLVDHINTPDISKTFTLEDGTEIILAIKK